WRTVIASGEFGEIEARLRRFDGEYRWFLFRAAPLCDASGKLAGWCGTNIDIDERHRAEEYVRASELQFRTTVDRIPGLVALVDPKGEIEFVNRGALEYFGRTLEELQNWRMSDVIHAEDLPSILATWQHAVDTGQPPEWTARLRRG